MRIYDLVVDEDGVVNLDVYECVGEFVERSMDWIGVFVNEWDSVKVERVDIERVDEYLGEGSEEKDKFVKYGEKLNNMMKRYKGMVLVSYGVEYDNCWVMMKERMYERFVEKCRKVCNEEGE